MSNIIKSILLIVTIAGTLIFFMHRQVRDRVEQELRNDVGVLCNNDNYCCYVTTVWKDNNIIKSWYDNPNTITDSIKNTRIKEGLRLLKNTKTKITYK